MMAFLSTRSMTLVALFAALLAVGACIGIATLIERKGNAFEAQMQAFTDEHAYERRYAALETLASSTAPARAEVNALILHNEDDTVAFLSAIDDIADRLRIDVVTKSLTVEEQKKEPYNTLLITFEADGPEAAVTDMVAIWEALPYHSRIVSVELSRRTDEESGAPYMRATAVIGVTIEK